MRVKDDDDDVPIVRFNGDGEYSIQYEDKLYVTCEEVLC